VRQRVVIPSNCCAFQLGETCQILSGGLLRATPHAVLTDPTSCTTNGVTRESFAVFMEPEYDHRLDPPHGVSANDCLGTEATDMLHQELGLSLLSARWKPGMTYGEFHLATVSAFAVPNEDEK
jgi:isopenicillin N synthase-like dioxygenase